MNIYVINYKLYIWMNVLMKDMNKCANKRFDVPL